MSVYHGLLAFLFSLMAAAAVVLAVRLLRSWRTASLRFLHTGVCVYVAIFIPYAVLQAVTLGMLAAPNSRLNAATAQSHRSAGFALFFCLCFAGNLALVQMWIHLVRQHTSSLHMPDRLQSALASMLKVFVCVVAVTVSMYFIGFATLDKNLKSSYDGCVAVNDAACVSMSQALPPSCSDITPSILSFWRYEGAWAFAVLLGFALLALFFYGVVFAMYVRAVICCSAPPFCVTRSRLSNPGSLSKLQLRLVQSSSMRRLARPLVPEGWTPSIAQTTGEADAQRVTLLVLGKRLAVLSIFSLLCHSVCAFSVISGATDKWETTYLVATFLAQAVPCSLTLMLLNRLFFGGGSLRTGVLMQSLINPSLLHFESTADADSSESVIAIGARPNTATVPYAAPRSTGGSDRWELRMDTTLNREFYYNLDSKELSWTLPPKLQSRV
jgi:hypothetical protein